MTTAECIRQRVSCRRFQEKPIPREDIRRVVDLARFSPSWKNTQPVRYVVVDDPVLKERIARESPARASTPRPSTGPPLWRWSPTFPACPARETPP